MAATVAWCCVVGIIEEMAQDYEEMPQDVLPPIVPAIAHRDKLPKMPAEIIEGVLHEGMKATISGTSKGGKTWLALALALAIATGTEWLEMKCAQGKVLYVNLEVSEYFFHKRIAHLAEKMRLDANQVEKCLDTWTLRGHVSTLDDITSKLGQLGKQKAYSMIVLDPIYKLENGADENAAGAISDLVNAIDRLAVGMGSAVLVVHHHSKGKQGNKAAQDRFSGSGVFARDPDALLDITALDAAGVSDQIEAMHRKATPCRLSFVLRNEPPKDPVDLWFYGNYHEVDHTGLLEGCLFDGEGKKDKYAQTELNRVEAAIDAAIEGKDYVLRREIQKAMGYKSARTISKRLKQSSRYEEKIVSNNCVEIWPRKHDDA